MKILILDSHANASLAIVQSLGRAGHKIALAGATSKPLSWKSRYPIDRWIYPDPLHNQELFQDWLVETQATYGFDYIVPVTDSSIYPAMELLRNGWGNDSLVLPPSAAFDWIYDKGKTIELARLCDVSVPEGVEITSENWTPDQFQHFPYFVKPVQSKAWSQGTGRKLAPRLSRNRQELQLFVDQLLGSCGTVIVQEYVSGWGVGVGVLCNAGEILTWFAYRRVHEYPLTGGASTYRVSCEPSAGLIEACRRMMAKIGWTGVAMIEFKDHGEESVLMEINGRFWGSLPLAIASGVDFPRDLIDLLTDARKPSQPDYRHHLYVRRLDTDFAWFKENLRADKTDEFLLTRPVGQSLLELPRVLLGRERWDHASWRDPLPILALAKRIVMDEISRRWNQLRSLLNLRLGRRITQSRLRRGKPRNLLIVCYGNICRSPFVEFSLRSMLNPAGYEVRSTGFHDAVNRETPEEFARTTAGVGIDLTRHRSSVIDRESIDWADLVVIMDRDNARRLRTFGRAAMRKTVWLGGVFDKGSVEIQDPYGRPQQEMRQITIRMKKACELFADRLGAD